jgi:hypothetical protein
MRPILVRRNERRSKIRPAEGDVKLCPDCGAAMRFSELRVAGPAWLCRNGECLRVQFVRRARDPRERQARKKLIVTSRRRS